MSDPTDADTKDTGSVIGNGLKVALIAGGVLGAGFLFWRLAYGKGEDSEEKKTEAEAQAAPATAAAVAPSASCACHGAPHALPAPVDGNLLAMMEALQPHGEPVVRVGNQWLTLPEVRRAVLQRVAA